jgi:hypothetical protein
MNSFSQFGINVVSKCFVGDKIKISKIIGKQIVVHDFKIEDSKVQSFADRGANQCLHLQISINNDMFIVFTSAGGLLEAIQQIPTDGFPFSTTIVKDNDRFIFT